MTDSPIDLSAQSLAEMVSQEGIEPNPIIVELTRRLRDVAEREKRTREALLVIRDIAALTTGRPYTALSQIDEIARKGLA